MKKILPYVAGFLVGAFALLVFALVISLTFSALGRIFPDNFFNQITGVALFDIATVVWLVALIYQSQTPGQYAVALIGFLIGIVGTLGMVAAEVMMSSGAMVGTDASMMRTISYTFIFAAVAHLVLIYLHHMLEKDVDMSIRMGVAKAQVFEDAMRQTDVAVEESKIVMGQMIRNQLLGDLARQMNLPMTDTELSDLFGADIKMAPHMEKQSFKWKFWERDKKPAAEQGQEYAQTVATPIPLSSDTTPVDATDPKEPAPQGD